MATVTLAPEILDGLVTALRARTGYRGPTDMTSGVTVYDGPEFLRYQSTGTSYVIVGYGGEDTVEAGDISDDATRGDVSVRAIATTSPKRDEASIDFLCQYAAGDFDVAAARMAVRDIGNDVDSTLRSDPKLGIAPGSSGQVLWVQVTGWSLRTFLAGTQLVAQLRLTLTFNART